MTAVENDASESCIDPTVIQEGDLMTYVDGTASEAVVQHVRRCPACARQAEKLAALQAALTTSVYRHSCPTSGKLTAYQQDELAGNEKLVVARHLRRCPHCARELAALAREERVSLRERLGAVVEELQAALVTPQAKAPVLREAPGEARPRQQVYRAGEIEVVLGLRPVWAQLHQWDLSGMVHVGGQVPETVGGAKVELYHGEGLIAVATVGPRGWFTFADVESGDYDLSLVWEHRDVRLEGVRVG